MHLFALNHLQRQTPPIALLLPYQWMSALIRSCDRAIRAISTQPNGNAHF